MLITPCSIRALEGIPPPTLQPSVCLALSPTQTGRLCPPSWSQLPVRRPLPLPVSGPKSLPVFFYCGNMCWGKKQLYSFAPEVTAAAMDPLHVCQNVCVNVYDSEHVCDNMCGCARVRGCGYLRRKMHVHVRMCVHLCECGRVYKRACVCVHLCAWGLVHVCRGV